MFVNKVEALNMARAMAAHAAAQQGVTARNVANADTPGYRARRLPGFAEVWEGGGQPLRTTRAGHLDPPGRRHVVAAEDPANRNPNGNSVSLEAEMVQAADARQQHELALAIHGTLSGAIRATLGRR